MPGATHYAMRFAERGLLPDGLIRAGIRRLCADRLRDIGAHEPAMAAQMTAQLLEQMDRSPIAVQVQSANAQHYEVPPAFFHTVLGPHMKYSACWWSTNTVNLAQAEEDALRLTCEYAGLEDGQHVLELGCGWGSLTLWMGARYPNSRIVAVSNSASQRRHILNEASTRGLRNIDVVTCDMNSFHPELTFDRVVSVEMFEHMRNWRALFDRVHGWLRPGGYFYMHVFCHRSTPYLFEPRDDSDWMSRHFFSGGLMPSEGLPLHVCQPLRLTNQWTWDGTHYARTAEAWLDNLDHHRHAAQAMLRAAHTPDSGQADHRVQRWRIFFMACAELFGYRQGREWRVSHYRFSRHV